jgi:methionyl aminopeptidase
MYRISGEYIIKNNFLKGVNRFFNNNNFTNYRDNLDQDNLDQDNYPQDTDIISSLQLSSSIHKKVRRELQSYLKPDITLLSIAQIIESKTIELSNQSKSINKGIGFPASLALNDCAAHFHPNSNDNVKFTKDDIIKIDFGTEVNGWITDSAFTVYFDDKFDNLAKAVKEATYTGIKNAGIDVDIGDWAIKIQEVMESYEIELNGKIYPIKTIKNLYGHNIIKGIIHGGMFLPTTNMKSTLPPNYRFKEGVYAIETFGSTGDAEVIESGESTLYMANSSKLELSKYESELSKKIKHAFKTLPFTNRYIEIFNINNYKKELNILTNNNVINTFRPLYVNKGAYTAQYEHTIYIGENKKIVLSSSDDY